MAEADSTAVKKCGACGEIKAVSSFYKNRSRKDGFHHSCQPCAIASRADSNRKHRDKIAAREASKRASDPIKYRNMQNQSRLKRADHYNAKARAFYAKNAERMRAYRRRYRAENMAACSKCQVIANAKRRKIDPMYRVSCALRRRVTGAMRDRGYTKSSKSTELLGCDWGQLRGHIESKFQSGMTFQNYGQWHVDHIIPIASAKNEAELNRLFHYTNLQPLWAEDNRRKGASMP